MKLTASLWKITTDKDGESKLIFLIPSNELANVVQMNAMFLKELKLEVTSSDRKKPDTGRSDL